MRLRQGGSEYSAGISNKKGCEQLSAHSPNYIFNKVYFILRTILQPIGCENYQVIHIGFSIAVVIFACRAGSIRGEVIVFCFTNLVFCQGAGAAIAQLTGITAGLPWLL